MRTRIAPSILSADFANLAAEIRSVEAAGAEWIHVDVMDGHFVPNITIGPLIVEAIRPVTGLPLDVHLMIENPENFVLPFSQAGADLITVHVETGYHLFRTVDLIKQQGKKAGVALNPATPLAAVKHLIHVIDLLLIMTVNPGFGGQTYIDPMTEKIREARMMVDASGREIVLQVDGGIKASNARTVTEAGAEVLVMGSEIFRSPDYTSKIREIRNAVD
ncbi:MAG TPA: ribulose-phosphate 3-epimerase [Deltaproteobacteria bacterium]|nr:ribulose-phosphate 3-epimerase [Deltaproteobacteria bacterium]